MSLVSNRPLDGEVYEFIEWSAQQLGITISFEGQGVDEVAIVDKIEGGNVPSLKVGQKMERTDLPIAKAICSTAIPAVRSSSERFRELGGA